MVDAAVVDAAVADAVQQWRIQHFWMQMTTKKVIMVLTGQDEFTVIERLIRTCVYSFLQLHSKVFSTMDLGGMCALCFPLILGFSCLS